MPPLSSYRNTPLHAHIHNCIQTVHLHLQQLPDPFEGASYNHKIFASSRRKSGLTRCFDERMLSKLGLYMKNCVKAGRRSAASQSAAYIGAHGTVTSR